MENSIKLSDERKEKLVNELLIYMKNELEAKGCRYNACFFNFAMPANISDCFDSPITNEEFISVMNYCLTHDFIQESLGMIKRFSSVQLTEAGFGRATSVSRSKYKPGITDGMADVKIGTINATNLQIGNNNIQNITNVFQQLIDEINNADCTEQEKKTALTQLKTFINNPIVSNIISGVGVELLKKLTGLGI